MYKKQTRGRKIYSSLGGLTGIITIIIVIAIVIALIVWYARKKIKERQDDLDDFLRYQRLIKQYLRIKRENLHFTEDRVQYEMDRFEFSDKLLPVGDASQNLTWDTDSSTFGDLCNSLMGMVSYGSDPTSKYYKNNLLWKQILYAIRIIAAKLPDVPKDYNMPWGTNWYQFSITYPTFLVSTAFSYYEIFNTEDPFMIRHLASYINNYFKESPVADGLKSLGWLRSESNVIGMSVPLIGGRLYANRFNPNANSQIYARDYLTINYVYTGNGFYYDNTYITHVSRNDGYTTSFYNEFVFVYDFYRMTSKFFKVLHRNFSILEHPDFPLHHGPWFNRGSSMKGFAPGRKYAKYGVDIRGYERGVCVRTKNVSLHYCGQILPLAAYESDRTNQEWAQCWVFMRRPITKNSAENLYKELVPYYDGVHSYGRKQINWPSTTTTTTTFDPESALCSLCCIEDRAAGMYNKYRIKMASKYTFDIEEINLATPTGFHVYFKCQVDSNLAATDPYTIAVRLGELEPNQEANRLTGVGSNFAYAFDNFIATFLYLENIDEENKDTTIHVDEIKDPATGKILNALYVQPTQRQIFEFGFSNNFYDYDTEKRHNNLNARPTMNVLSTDDFKLEKTNTDDALLFLHDYKNNVSHVSYAFNYTLPKSITIKKSTLDDMFVSYSVFNGIFDSTTGVYTVGTFERQFQITLTNVIYK